MVTFSTKSWHYWLASFSDVDLQRNKNLTLCQYWRKVLSNLLLCICLGVLALAIACGVLAVLASMLLSVVSWIFDITFKSKLLNNATQSGKIYFVIVTVITVSCWIKNKREEAQRRKWDRENDPSYVEPVKRDSLIKAWIKAKKEKICPIVKFE